MAKDHALERKKPFYAKTKVSAEKSVNFLYAIVALYLRVLLCIRTCVGHVMCLKRLITVPFERSEPFHLLRACWCHPYIYSLPTL